MIGHQHIGVHSTCEARGEFVQVPQIDEVVRVGEKAGAAIVAALDDMQRHIGNPQAGTAGHGHGVSWMR